MAYAITDLDLRITTAFVDTLYHGYAHALNNMDKDLLLVAKDDIMGRRMQDLNLPIRKRAPRREE